MIRLENSDRGKAETSINSIPLVDLSKEQSAKSLDRTSTIGGPVNAEARVQFSNIYNECCTGVDKSRGPQNRNERAEPQGAATDPKWGSARDRLTKSDSQKNEIREKGYREIQYGDTLSDIAKANLELKNGGKAASGAEIWREVERLAKLNNLDPRKNIRPGTKIYMEKCEDQNKPKTADAEPSAPSTRDAGKKVDGQQDSPPAQVETKPDNLPPTGPDEDRDRIEGRKPGLKDAQDDHDKETAEPDQTLTPQEFESATDRDVQKSTDFDLPQDDPPVNFSPYESAPTDEGLRPREDSPAQEQQRKEQELKEREEALKSKDEDLRRKEENLKKQLEDLQRQKDELRRREEELNRCGTGKDDAGVWEH